jgi:pyruvate,water dikinase
MGFEHMNVALSIGVQRMVHADRAGAGVMFSIDTESGFPKVVEINAAWGLGESVVQGTVIPDQYTVFNPLLDDHRFAPIIDKTRGPKETKVVYPRSGSGTDILPTTAAERQAFVLGDDEILQLARWAVVIERHYGTPMDIEWAKDADSDELFIVQARPETVQSQRVTGAVKAYRLLEKGRPLVTGLSIGEAIAAGRACVIAGVEGIARFIPGSILVAETTSPDWVPVMKLAVAIITDHGGRTSHAAIVTVSWASRRLLAPETPPTYWLRDRS